MRDYWDMGDNIRVFNLFRKNKSTINKNFTLKLLAVVCIRVSSNDSTQRLHWVMIGRGFHGLLKK